MVAGGGLERGEECENDECSFISASSAHDTFSSGKIVVNFVFVEATA